MNNKPTLGFIGLGLMGKPMAAHLLKAGFVLWVHNRSQAAVDELVSQGAHKANLAKEVAQHADIIMTCLPDSPDVEACVLGEDGILAGAKQGLIVIDHSTIKPATARHLAAALAARGMHFLDAPVSGGQIGAQNGTLTTMVGGDAGALETARPALEAFSKAITHIGGPGAGQVAKCCNQMMVAAQMAAMAELLILARKAEVDPQKVVAAIQGGAAQCWALDNKPQLLFAGNRQPGFKAYMQVKDLGIVMETAKELGMPLPATAANTQLFNAMMALGMQDLDNSAIVGVMEQLAGVELL
ncbi:MAG TPA: NAD(P)-binding domain-containing protein [Anaerolineales bacterium]|nr:NAD(P)-binding domain-containing protein [Anaerolineales bacterium]HRQ92751.1 NAD(P)-binding domain-containing protein [Anaerolineales bacterium]